MTYKEAVKMQYRRDWAVDACQRYGLDNQPCRDAVAIVEIQERNVQLSEGMRAAMFPLSSYAVVFLFGVLCRSAISRNASKRRGRKKGR